MDVGARQIYQSTLDQLTMAIMSHDADLWAAHMQVPHFMTTCDGKLAHESERDVRVGLTDYHLALKKLGVTRMLRSCDTARFTNEETIVGFHTTQMLTRDGTEYPKYPVRWVMQAEDGVWRVAKSDSALSSAGWATIPHNTLTQFDAVGGDKTKARRMLVQTLLDRIDAVYMAGDFEGWLNSVALPIVFETRNGTGIFHTEEELRQDFELYQKEFRIHKISDLMRVVTTVDQLSDGKLVGKYRVHVLSGTQYVVPPWDAAATFDQIDGIWRLTKLSGALGHLNWNNNAGRQQEQLVPSHLKSLKNRDDGELK